MFGLLSGCGLVWFVEWVWFGLLSGCGFVCLVGVVWFFECVWFGLLSVSVFGLVCKYTKSGEGRGKDEEEEIN